MEYFPNLSVEDYVLKVGWLRYRTARTFALQMANAIAYLHGRKPHHFIHRDIKPSVTAPGSGPGPGPDPIASPK